ncbi:glycine decarboxylase subunit T [Cyberlindnera jadinii NRRL Y-1542]|uniref:Aminomethyltransferase n=1 Tax=Cyberlindnera jadinii (strain ATCC 18201 / CBS 1600 / BCRC 20928 / JCM 3617 / NBRC 0987 / NRRL Y-1542) TaxID=983966 RepID=A0A1E4S0R1_CYBJN|nr:glycine cleavage system T protein [Cyberlindnera jadinii NRRL Y-1542]ODV73082.1 glycine cleavage system T protein [Cyberlindnera jadinii NRRL Y-1542]
MFRRAYSTASSTPLLKTPLYNLHISLGGDMVEFAGYAMPVLYKGFSHIDSHRWTREHAGLFDVSHMLQQKISGKDVIPLFDKITPTDFKPLKPWHNQLSVLLNEEGGIVDDTIITKHDDDEHFYVVTNAGTRAKDQAFFKKYAEGLDVKFEVIDSTLLAIQGPSAQKVLQKFTNEDLSKIYFGNSKYIIVPGFNNAELHLARGGYTGEDGFEVSIPNDIAEDLAKALLEDPELKPVGLAARDSLRLEAGMCLYGHDLNDTITPVEGSLSWVISKTKRDPATAKFNGSSKILAQLADRSLVKQQRVGFQLKGPAAREGCKIFDVDSPEKQIGVVTSGSASPSLEGRINIGQAYIDRGYHKSGTKVLIEIRNKKREGVIAKQPFIAPKYYRE